MNPEEFKKQFNHANDIMFGGKNDRVVIVTNNPSVGGRHRIPVSHVTSGFDWERGDIIIGASEKIISEEHYQKADIINFIYNIPPNAWKSIRNSKNDIECREYLKKIIK